MGTRRIGRNPLDTQTQNLKKKYTMYKNYTVRSKRSDTGWRGARLCGCGVCCWLGALRCACLRVKFYASSMLGLVFGALAKALPFAVTPDRFGTRPKPTCTLQINCYLDLNTRPHCSWRLNEKRSHRDSTGKNSLQERINIYKFVYPCGLSII